MRIIRISENALLDKKEEDKQSKTFEERLLYNKKQLLLNRPEISLIIDCKIKANEIINLMNDLEIDIRLRYVMKFFKGLYQTTENFAEYDYPVKD